MDFIRIISSVNKISLIAFIITFGFLIYEIFLFTKEKNKKNRPNIPQFSPLPSSNHLKAQSTITVNPPVKKTTTINHRSHYLLILILVVMVMILGGVIIYSSLGVLKNIKTPIKNQSKTTTFVSEISSPGLKIYDTNWEEISNNNLSDFKNKKIIIGIETITEADIDKARIRINDSLWKIDHITSLFSKEKNSFYKEYAIASNESRLKIDAQLHSLSDGWLGD